MKKFSSTLLAMLICCIVSFGSNASLNANFLTLSDVNAPYPGCDDPTAANYDSMATSNDGSCLYDATFNVDMNCESGFTTVGISGPYVGWCDNCLELTDIGGGIWSGTFQLPAGPFEYKYMVDNFASQEDLVDDMVGGATCAPVTDFSGYANRLEDITAGVVFDDTYGTCGICDPTSGCTNSLANNYDSAATTDDGSCLFDVEFNVDMNCQGGFSNVNVTGPFVGWCANCLPLTDGDGDGIWSGTFSLPAMTFEYKYNTDDFAFQEDLVDDMVGGASCAPITDFATFANREIVVGGGAIANDTYGSCDPCIPMGTFGCMDSGAVNYDSTASMDDGSCLYDVVFNVDMNCESGFSNVNVTGPFVGWCANCLPLADGDGDGIWSGTFQLPAGPFEYKYNTDDFLFQEDLVDDMVAGGSCAPITDFFSFANREITIAAGTVADDTYGTCGVCFIDPNGCTDSTAANYAAGATIDDGSCLYTVEFNVDVNCESGIGAVNVTGPDLGWCLGCETMDDSDADGIYTTTIDLPMGDFEYKYREPGIGDAEFCATYWQHLNLPGEVPSAIYVRIENVDAFSMIVEIESADADAVDFLQVLGGSGATISAQDFSVPGKISQTLTWITPPTDVLLNILWSKDSFGGNWQLLGSDVTVAFASSCSVDPSEGEDLLDDAIAGGACVGSTDLSTYANRVISVTGAGLVVDDAYASCDACVPTVLGCTYVEADNYNPAANDDDGSCTFSLDSCPGDTDGNNIVNILDLVSVSSNFGNTCP